MSHVGVAHNLDRVVFDNHGQKRNLRGGNLDPHGHVVVGVRYCDDSTRSVQPDPFLVEVSPLLPGDRPSSSELDPQAATGRLDPVC